MQIFNPDEIVFNPKRDLSGMIHHCAINDHKCRAVVLRPDSWYGTPISFQVRCQCLLMDKAIYLPLILKDKNSFLRLSNVFHSDTSSM